MADGGSTVNKINAVDSVGEFPVNIIVSGDRVEIDWRSSKDWFPDRLDFSRTELLLALGSDPMEAS